MARSARLSRVRGRSATGGPVPVRHRQSGHPYSSSCSARGCSASSSRVGLGCQGSALAARSRPLMRSTYRQASRCPMQPTTPMQRPVVGDCLSDLPDSPPLDRQHHRSGARTRSVGGQECTHRKHERAFRRGRPPASFWAGRTRPHIKHVRSCLVDRPPSQLPNRIGAADTTSPHPPCQHR
jgi:hypothetical protein